MSLQKVIETAKSQLGITEYPPGSNHVLYNTEYYGKDVSGPYFPWCVTFLWWVFKTANDSKAFFNGGKTASCTILRDLYKAEGRWFTGGLYMPGDIAIMNFKGTDEPQHCGLIISTGTPATIYYKIIEGNTSPGEEGSQDNGGSVALKTRYPSQIIGVCRPRYTPEIQIKTDWEDHWAKDAIQWGMDNKIISGYPDGTFRPNGTMTRAEAITMAKNLADYILSHK